MTDRARDQFTDVVLQRVYGEFLEMPGLRLTPGQAQRLWGLDEQTCLQLLEFLVDAKFLSRSAQGAYSRCTDGPPSLPRPRMAKAGIEAVRHDTKKAG